jgi:hypothetical protein
MSTQTKQILEERPSASLEAVAAEFVSSQGSLADSPMKTSEDQLWAIIDMIPAEKDTSLL